MACENLVGVAAARLWRAIVHCPASRNKPNPSIEASYRVAENQILARRAHYRRLLRTHIRDSHPFEADL